MTHDGLVFTCIVEIFVKCISASIKIARFILGSSGKSVIRQVEI